MIHRRALRSAAVLLGASVVFGCAGSACENKVTYGAPSPDGELIAFIFHRRCGADGDVSTHVSVIAFHDALRTDTGNVLAVPGEQPVKVSWRGPKDLMVTGFRDPTYQRTSGIASVTIDFR